MPEITCQCGRSLSVTFSDAGSRKTCRQCGADVAVPSLVALKRLSGDRDPLLGNWEKLVKAIQLREPPFEGTCQKCAARRAQVAVEIELSVLAKRVLSGERLHDQAAMYTPVDGVAAAEGDSEYWNTVTIPHLLCDQCHDDFAAMHRWRRIPRSARFIVGIILAPVAILIVLTLAQLASYVKLAGTLLGTVLVFLWFAVQRRWRKDTRLTQWMLRVPLVKDILQSEDEYSLVKRRTVRLGEERASDE